ncbi:hypothetical protein Sjap_009910 [Stephania japonica]|uniref:GDSL esterase/lipase EXL3 n=1 Tax=Stephania japonica TaxID=461633 RepID=A0AAP0JAQ7_9MAGN
MKRTVKFEKEKERDRDFSQLPSDCPHLRLHIQLEMEYMMFDDLRPTREEWVIRKNSQVNISIFFTCCTYRLTAQSLGIKELLPAYLDPNLKPADLLTGVCFASGAAGYDPLTAKVVNVLGLSAQINMFKEYIGKLKAMVGEERSASILSNSLYLVVGGSDDIANTYLGTPFRKFKYDIPAYTDLMVRGAAAFIQELYDLGARRFGVFSAPPLGCLPSQRTLRGGKQRTCVDGPNQAALLFNSKLFAALARFNIKYSESKAIYIDTYSSILQIINNPHSYGFEEVSRGCCGTGKLEVSILCNKLSPGTCSDPSKYVFWDSYHPTEKTYKILVDELLQKNVDKFF